MTPKKTLSVFILLFTALGLSYLASIEYFGISKDIQEYRNFFDTSGEYKGRFEKLFVLTTTTLKTISPHFSDFLFFITFFSLLLKFSVLSNFKIYLLNLALYIILLFPLHELTQYRVSIALALLYSALLLRYYDRLFVLACALFAAGVLFHYSTAAFLPILLGWNFLKKNFSIKIPIAVVLLCLLWVFKPTIQEYVSVLNPTLIGAETVRGNPFSSRNLILMTVLVIGVLNWDKLAPDVRPYYFTSVYGFILWFIFIDVPIYSHRLFEMTFFAYFIWVSELKGLYRQGAYALLLILAAYLTYRQLYIEPLFS